MKYIHLPNDTGIEFDRYAAYILPIRDSFPLNIRQLVSDPKFYDLSSEETFHDANIEEIRIQEIPPDRNLKISSSVSIHILLNGARRKTRLEYRGVRRYRVKGENDFGYFDSFHSDLYTHEFRIEEDGIFVHEIEFVTASGIEIAFEELDFKQEVYE